MIFQKKIACLAGIIRRRSQPTAHVFIQGIQPK
jgi:hypothetical protein